MSDVNSSLLRTPPHTHRFTTLLASGWGLFSAYLFFNSLLITHDVRLCCVGLVPLVIVWATLERKRWGRIALLGLSATALGMFVLAVAYLASFGIHLTQEQPSSLAQDMQIALRLFSNNPNTALMVLALAMMTGLWLCRREVVAEFERGKRESLAVAQHLIALCLVGCWGLTVAFSPLAITNQILETTPSTSSSSAHGAQYTGSRFGI